MDKTVGIYTICPASSDPFYIVSYYIKWVTTSWTHSMYFQSSDCESKFCCAHTASKDDHHSESRSLA